MFFKSVFLIMSQPTCVGLLVVFMVTVSGICPFWMLNVYNLKLKLPVSSLPSVRPHRKVITWGLLAIKLRVEHSYSSLGRVRSNGRLSFPMLWNSLHNNHRSSRSNSRTKAFTLHIIRLMSFLINNSSN